MALNKAVSKYQENSILTASPEELTLMLYNGLVRYIIQASKSIDEKNTERAHDCIIYAQDIIAEFQATLDLKYDISQNLMLLYDFMHRRLIDANVKKDKEILNEVLRLAKELRDTWEQAMKLAKTQTQPEQKAK